MSVTARVAFAVLSTVVLYSGAYAEEGIVPRAFRSLKQAVGDDVLLVADVCMCEYTSHGHCGIIENGDVCNDATLELLAKASVVYAQAGADILAPSDSDLILSACLAEPEEIARGVLFLVDPASEYINGSTLSIDGGNQLPWWSKRGTGTL